jgi:hypothetical protein
MSEPVGPIEICCDAPPYPVVRGCRLLGFHSPEDVRWCRLSHLPARTQGQEGSLLGELLRAMLGRAVREVECRCGERIVHIPEFCMTFSTGEKARYLLAQCRRCHTVFWDDA